LSLKVSCGGSAPFNHCLSFHSGAYNITGILKCKTVSVVLVNVWMSIVGNETCEYPDISVNCEFPITRYFPQRVKTVTTVIIINNDVAKIVHPVTINIYEGNLNILMLSSYI
jgi:hypothetical protein